MAEGAGADGSEAVLLGEVFYADDGFQGFRLQVSGCRLQVAGFRSERATYCWDSELLVMLLEQEVGEWNSERTGFVLNIRA